MRGHWIELEDAADLVDEIMALVGVVAKEGKRPPNPLSRSGFDEAVKRTIREGVRATEGIDGAAIKSALVHIDRDWPKMSPAERDIATEAIGKAQLEAGGIAAPVFGKVVRDRFEDMVGKTKEASVRRFDLSIDAGLTGTDQRIIDYARDSQSGFILDEYGRRSDAYSKLARDVVASGLEDGLDAESISGDLLDTLEEAGLARSLWYWRAVASVQMARARSYGQLRSFKDAGIELYVFTAVLDERTTDQCRFLDGRVFSVETALTKFDEAAEADDPMDIIAISPFMRVGRNEEGQRELYYNLGERRVSVATVDRSGVGESDDKGEYSKALSDRQIEDAGLCTPPLHELCRSVLLPSFGTV